MKEVTLKILGTGKYIPPKTITNADLEKMVETTDEWIVSHTGIRVRHQAVDENTSDLGYQAALNALTKSKINPETIDAIIVATLTPDRKSPSVASLIQAKLGLNHRDIMCFDVNAACTGFVYALQIATGLLHTSSMRNILVIGAEVLTKVLDYKDRNTCILFGDGAGALIVSKGNQQHQASFYTASQGDIESTLVVDDILKMEGRKVYRFAIGAVEKSIKQLLDMNHLNLDQIDQIIPHQANYRIIETVANNMKLPIEKFFLNIEKYGNTSAASIPICLDEYFDAHPYLPGQRIMLVGFGAGLTWGGALLTL
jgi:3-oxoacyl-[acyl-carrier-protein] synthase-3